MCQHVYAVVDNAIQTEIIVERLRLNGIPSDAISVSGPGGQEGASFLAGLGLSEDKARRFEAKIEMGGILMAVRSEASEETMLAQRIFRETCLKHVTPSEEREAVLV